MSDKNPPLTDYQKTFYTPEEQELLKLGVHIVRYDYSESDVERAKNLVQSVRQFMGQSPFTEEELDSIISGLKINPNSN